MEPRRCLLSWPPVNRRHVQVVPYDGPVAYSFLPVLDGTQVLKTEGGNLTSQGANVLFALSGGMLIGYVDVGAAGYVDGIAKVCTSMSRLAGHLVLADAEVAIPRR